eukprot:3241228-Pyramimonas_sp.AAC.1
MNAFTSMTRNQQILGQRRLAGTRDAALPIRAGHIRAGHGSNINIIGLRTAQARERASRSHGHDIKTPSLNNILYATGADQGAAVCRASGH